jgi:hypothetical protein
MNIGISLVSVNIVKIYYYEHIINDISDTNITIQSLTIYQTYLLSCLKKPVTQMLRYSSLF